MTETFVDVCTGRENWFNPSVLGLQRQMRIAYERSDEALVREQELMEQRLLDYSHNAVGKKMKELLDE